VDRVRGFVHSADSIYDRFLADVKGKTPASVERCDCAEDPAYALPGMNDGITVLYRAPRFGRLQHKESHSGWECLRLVK
jgi:hypothetical protein